MRQILILTKILLKSGAGLQNENTKKKIGFGSKISKPALYVFLLICFMPVMFMLYQAGYNGAKILDGLNQSLILGVTNAGMSLMIFVLAIPMMISVYYLSSDIEYLLPLPLKPKAIISAKFVVTLITEYMIILISMLPLYIGYGVYIKGDILYWINSVIAMVLVPIVPMIYAGIIALVIMRFAKGAKNKDMITVLATIITLVLVLGINTFINGFGNMEADKIIELLTTKGKDITNIISAIFPTTILLTDAVAASQISSMLLFIAANILLFLVFLVLAERIYFAGVKNATGSATKKKKLTQNEKDKLITTTSPIKAYFKKELKLLVRTPIYFLNCILISIIWPIIFLIPTLFSMLKDDGQTAEQTASAAAAEPMSVAAIGGLCILIVVAATIFVSSLNFISGTSISREGKNYTFMKYIPMSYKDQIIAKLLSGLVISIISSTCYLTIGMFVIKYAFDVKIPIEAIIISIIASLLLNVLVNTLSLLIDISRPKLNWIDEQAAVKQNTNTFISMAVEMFIGAIFCVGGFFLAGLIDYRIVAIGLIIITAVITVLLLKYTFAYAQKKIRSLEN